MILKTYNCRRFNKLMIYNFEKTTIMKPKLKYSPSEYWDFIEKYYPHYYSCDDVLMCDILSRKLHGYPICAEDEAYIEGWNFKEELIKIETELFQIALENYFELVY